MKDILIKLANNESITMDEFYNIVEFIWKKENPDKTYDAEITKKAVTIGIGSQIIQTLFNQFMEHPWDYGFTVMVIRDKKGNLIKTIIEET